MLSYLEALILGLVQGLTEFLPVSSSGHIELVKAIFGEELKEGLLLTVALHVATALSTILVFRKDVWSIIKDVLTFKWNENTRFSWLIIISMVPAVLIGLTLEDAIDDLFNGNVLLVSLMLIVTGVLLIYSDRSYTRGVKIKPASALLIGVVQAIAILPGISRSGSTVSAALMLGVSRDQATRFSFLMVVPVILGAGAKSLLDYLKMDQTEAMIATGPLILAFVAAFVSGFFACRWMVSLIRNKRLTYFAIYCFAVAAIGLIWHLFQG
jgi:undecaprenyl-diphosphatase